MFGRVEFEHVAMLRLSVEDMYRGKALDLSTIRKAVMCVSATAQSLFVLLCYYMYGLLGACMHFPC